MFPAKADDGRDERKNYWPEARRQTETQRLRGWQKGCTWKSREAAAWQLKKGSI